MVWYSKVELITWFTIQRSYYFFWISNGCNYHTVGARILNARKPNQFENWTFYCSDFKWFGFQMFRTFELTIRKPNFFIIRKPKFSKELKKNFFIKWSRLLRPFCFSSIRNPNKMAAICSVFEWLKNKMATLA